MRALKGWIPTTFLAAMLLLGSVTANAGIITAGFADSGDKTTTDPCTVDTKDVEKFDSGIITAGYTGIITAGFTGIITAGLTGIIVTDFSSKEPVNCGIITAG
jgi:hypothetical protein